MLIAAPVEAHSFGRLYTLPVPFWLYAWGAAAALLLSFIAAAFFLQAPAPAAEARSPRSWRVPAGGWLLNSLRAMALGTLLLCIATGLYGPVDAYANLNMTLFWIVFVLAFAWATALLGDWYALINPWQTLTRFWPRAVRGLVRYPAWLGVWPAFAFYLAFIWLELLGRTTPHSLSLLLLAYTAINLAGAVLVGARDWFWHCEFFAVFLRLLALMAPLDVRAAGSGVQLAWRWPFAGLLKAEARSSSELLFILFMLASTAFDGLRETVPWVRLYWTDFYQLAMPWLGSNPFAAFPQLQAWYVWWQTAALLLAPLLYLAVYLAFIALSRWAAGSRESLRSLALVFAYSLLPIALVYHVTHYWTLLLTQGLQVFPLLTDPFGTGANWLGMRGWFGTAVIPDMNLVWHTQVGLIVFGHGVSVVIAHHVALRRFGSVRAASLSQLPMLGLMVVFTAAGLWILSQPLQG